MHLRAVDQQSPWPQAPTLRPRLRRAIAKLRGTSSGDSGITAFTQTAANTAPPDVSVAPAAVVVYSRFSNRRGVYWRAEADHKGFPVYSDAESELGAGALSLVGPPLPCGPSNGRRRS